MDVTVLLYLVIRFIATVMSLRVGALHSVTKLVGRSNVVAVSLALIACVMRAASCHRELIFAVAILSCNLSYIHERVRYKLCIDDASMPGRHSSTVSGGTLGTSL